jgi:hypothetical protein
MAGLSAGGRLVAGSHARAAAEAEADQLKARATMSRAIGSRQAERLRKAAERQRARARAVLAASGFSASDVGSRAIDEAVLKESTVNELLAVAQAEDEARQDEFRAKLRRQQGRGAELAGVLGAGRTLIEGAVSWRDRFGRPAEDAEVETGGAVFRGSEYDDTLYGAGY